MGNWLFGFSRSIGLCDALHAELWGILDGLTIAWSWRLRKVIIESDSQEAIDWIKKGNQAGCEDTLVDSIRRLCDGNWCVQFHHVYREANQVADHMAKRHSPGRDGVVVYTDPPPDVRNLLLTDMANMANSRQNASLL